MQISTAPVILSVDDSEQALDLRAAVLQMHGYAVLSTSSARQASAILETNHVDAIITDYDMPGENGIAFAGRLRELGHTMPIIMVSGSVGIPAHPIGHINEFLSKGEPISFVLSHLAAHLSWSGCSQKLPAWRVNGHGKQKNERSTASSTAVAYAKPSMLADDVQREGPAA